MGYFDIQNDHSEKKTYDSGSFDKQDGLGDKKTQNKGYFDIQGDPGDSKELDLTKFENKLIGQMNEAINSKIKSELQEFGIGYIEEEIKKEKDNKAEDPDEYSNNDKDKDKDKVIYPDVYSYNGEKITICPEPLEFLKRYDDNGNDVGAVHADFTAEIKAFQKGGLNKEEVKVFQEEGVNKEDQRTPIRFHQIKLNERPLSADENIMWRNKTTEAINLRPGNLNGNGERFDPIRMSDENVHGLIVGRTGSGKSVFINALLLSLITEYSPWELNLYLADFKKVELSRYMNDADENGKNAFTPHVNACAATSEIRYVVSLIRYLVDCMNARQEFFARIGVTKIQEFREKYDVVLPRVLLVVDEFQQMFKEATSREADEISVMLNSITKLGRATGFHLIFASQEMSGTLGGNTLANFKIRMALPCNQDISSSILGNGAAAKLEVGYVLINTEGGDEIQNQRYRVPRIKTEIKEEKKKKDDNKNKKKKKAPFYMYLGIIKTAAQRFGSDLDYKKTVQKFYQEDQQEGEEDYIQDLEDIREEKNKKVVKDNSLFDAVVLGKTVLYSPKANDKVSFYIEIGRNKGIMIACSEPDNAAKVRKLLAENLLRSDQETDHFGLEINNLIWERYPMQDIIKNDLIKYPKQRYYTCDIEDGIEFLEMIYYLRSNLMPSETKKEEFKKKENQLINLARDDEKWNTYKEYIDKVESIRSEISDYEKEIEKYTGEVRTIQTPIAYFFQKCGWRIYVQPESKTRADFFELLLYSDVLKIFDSESDIRIAGEKSREIVKNKIEELCNKNLENEEEKRDNDFLILRYKAFGVAMAFFVSKELGEDNPKKNSWNVDQVRIMENVYDSIGRVIDKIKKDRNEQKKIEEKLEELNEKKEDCEDFLDTLMYTPDPIAVEKEAIENCASEYIRSVYEKAYELSNYQEGKKEILSVECEYDREKEQLVWKYEKDFSDTCLQTVAEDLLDRYISICSMERDDRKEFKKTVFWINGLDAIEKFPSKFDEVVRDAINQNILVVAIITSELSDSYMRKLFDYAFVTGNIEKFYDMFNIRYTKQASDSIVVNFGIVSKGMNIPFKMYKTKLDTPEMSGFMDDLDALKNR